MISRLFFLLSLASPLFAQDGQQLYTLYCSACHGADGKGATGGTFPPLAESPWIAGDADRAVKITLKGFTGPVEVLGKTYNLEMPPQGAVLQDDQLAAILTYVRSSWGNSAAPVGADLVKSLRASIADRNGPWTAEELLKFHPLPIEKTALTNLISQAYSGKWSRLPDFTKVKAANVEEEQDGILSLKKVPFKEDFAMLWQAGFEAPADGEYEFLLDADDAAALFLDGKKIAEVTGDGPMDGSRATTGKVKLTKGSHPFRLEYLEMSGTEGISLCWKGPGVKNWKWLSKNKTKLVKNEPIPIESVNGRPVIYRNFIAGTTPRAIGVGFPGGLNLAWSADNLAPELLWTGKFIDGSNKWVDRGTDNNPPAGDHIVKLSGSPALPANVRFKGYSLDTAGNPTFTSQLILTGGTISDSWKPGVGLKQATLVRTLSLNDWSPPVNVLLSDKEPLTPIRNGDYSLGELTLHIENGTVETHGKSSFVVLNLSQPTTITYRWK